MVSKSSAGVNADRESYNGGISADGRYVAFYSGASNLVTDDTNGADDVFVRDTVTGDTRRVSVRRAGIQANSASLDPAISADGRYVAFTSRASNLVRGDTGGRDVFVRDTVTAETSRVSVGQGGTQANRISHDSAISADGRYVAFTSYATNLVGGDTNGTGDVFVRDRSAHTTRRVSVGPSGQANDASFDPAISANGRVVAFTSLASNLVARDSNGDYDVFVRDRSAHATQRVSAGSEGGQADGDSGGTAISSHGRYVAFTSLASNLVRGDTNGTGDVFVRDRSAHVTRRASVGQNGAEADDDSEEPAISAYGRHVTFTSYASNLMADDFNDEPDVFVHDRRP